MSKPATFKSPLFKMAPGYIADLNRLIERGETVKGITAWLKHTFKNARAFTPTAVLAYVDWRRSLPGISLRIAEAIPRAQPTRKEMLDFIVRTCTDRAKKLAEINENLFDPRIEQAIQGHHTLALDAMRLGGKE